MREALRYYSQIKGERDLLVTEAARLKEKVTQRSGKPDSLTRIQHQQARSVCCGGSIA